MKPPKEPGKAAPDQNQSYNDRAGGDLTQLAQDWITLWQSELTALATDRETAETWQALLAFWAGSAAAMLRAVPRGRSAPWWQNGGSQNGASPNGASQNGRDAPLRKRGARSARPAGAEGAAAPDAASDVRDAEIDRLHRIIVDLERRLADVERRAGQPRADRRSPGRVPRKR